MVEAIFIVFGAFLFSGAFILIVSYLIDWHENHERKSYFNKADFNTLPAAKEVSNSYKRVCVKSVRPSIVTFLLKHLKPCLKARDINLNGI